MESDDFESAIRLAVSLGGDSDTIACMTGGIAAAYYGVPQEIINKAIAYLPKEMLNIIEAFETKCNE
jgi:ADP-ribosylglycohydrolase